MNTKKIELLRQIGIKKKVEKVKDLKYIDWDKISENKILTEEFIREFSGYLNWSAICIYQELSEDFIREFKDKVYWYSIFKNQNLSRGFIYDFLPKVNWLAISSSKHLTDDLIIEFQDKISWELHFIHRESSFNIIKKFILKTDFKKLENFQTSHLTSEQKLAIEKMFKLKYMFTKENLN
jgi:hypothetical protein